MARINDSFTPGGLGILTPQDHGDLATDDKLHLRAMAAGVRITDRKSREAGGAFVEDEETRGDYSGFWYWDRGKDSRPIGSWREIFPVITPRKEGPITPGGGPAGTITPSSRTPFGATTPGGGGGLDYGKVADIFAGRRNDGSVSRNGGSRPNTCRLGLPDGLAAGGARVTRCVAGTLCESPDGIRTGRHRRTGVDAAQPGRPMGFDGVVPDREYVRLLR